MLEGWGNGHSSFLLKTESRSLSAHRETVRQHSFLPTWTDSLRSVRTLVITDAQLEAAEQVDETIDGESIELAGMKIDGSLAAGVPLEPGQQDDFPQLVPKLSESKVAGIIIGTPVYFGNMTSLCKAFLDRCIVFRKNRFALANKVAGVLAVGGCRNGGQELTVRSVQTALMCQELIIVGDGRPTGHFGATVWNSGEGEITDDEFGMSTVRNLGRRVAEVALRMA